MRKLFYLLLTAGALCLLPAILCAQSTGQINGQIKDTTGQAVIAATISLTKAKDSSLVKLAVSDEAGNFLLEGLQEDSYLLFVTSMSYKRFSIPVTIARAGEKISLPLIRLQSTDARRLKGVTVTAQQPLIERKIDRVVVNVDAMVSSTGTSALQVLENTPGVRVDNDGNIAIKGKQGVVIYINDKPTYLAGAELAAYLKGLPSNVLDKIEIMSTPPARYEAAGDAGIINIRTKRTREKGFNGSINAAYNQGIYWRTINSINFSYRLDRVTISGFAGFSQNNVLFDLKIDRKYWHTDGNPESAFEEYISDKRVTRNYNSKLGIDYRLSDRSSAGIILNGFIRPSSKDVHSTSNVFNGYAALDSFVNAHNTQDERYRNGSINVNFNHRYDSTGKELAVDLDYVTYRSKSDQLFLNSIYAPDQTLKGEDNLTGNLPANVNIYSAKADYTHPLRNGKIEAGVKSSYVKTNNEADYFALIGDNKLPDYDKTNDFRYTENINAIYLNANRSFNRLEVQLGLRLENTVAKGNQLGNVMKEDSSFKRNFTNLFPTAYITYKLDSAGNHMLAMNYGRRINRPYYQDLNPFVFPVDKFNYRYGNPFLKPQFADNIELSYSYKSNLNITLLYNTTNGIMGETIERTGNIFNSRPGNIGKNKLFGATVDVTFHPAEWWTINTYGELLNTSYKGALYSTYLDTSAYNYYLSASNQWKIGKTWSAEISGIYMSRTISGQFVIAAIRYLNAGVRKKILSNNGTIGLNVRDIFNSRVNKGNINNIPLASSAFRNIMDSRVITLSFTYNFGKAFNRKKDDTGTEAEQNRVKTN